MLSLALTLLFPGAALPRHEQSFHLDRRAEVVATVTASAEGCDWGEHPREAAVLALVVDGVYSQHVVLFGGGPADFRVLLGPIAPGEHRLSVAHDAKLSARGCGPALVEGVRLETVAEGEPGYVALAHAPFLHTRTRSLDRFTDVPLVGWVESRPVAGGGLELRYSVVFSHEDGGTPLDRLMATWGRPSDIELVYSVELDALGKIRREEYQGKDHVMTAFAGKKVGRHPVLHVVTKNNMLSARGRSTPLMAPAPLPFPLENVSREAVMDAHPWTYRISAREVRREGRVAETPGSGRIRDPLLFAYLEACGEARDAGIAFDLAFDAPGAGLTWRGSDERGPEFRVARSGCFRVAVALPEGRSVHEVRALRVRAHASRPRRGRPVPPGGGSFRLDRVNRLFGLEDGEIPGASLLRWQGPIDLRPGGDPLVIEVVRRVPANHFVR